jgi:hypothetical protein
MKSSTHLRKYDTLRWHVYTDNPETVYGVCIFLTTFNNLKSGWSIQWILVWKEIQCTGINLNVTDVT